MCLRHYQVLIMTGQKQTLTERKYYFLIKVIFPFLLPHKRVNKRVTNKSISIKKSRLLYCSFCILYIFSIATPASITSVQYWRIRHSSIHHLSSVLEYYCTVQTVQGYLNVVPDFFWHLHFSHSGTRLTMPDPLASWCSKKQYNWRQLGCLRK